VTQMGDNAIEEMTTKVDTLNNSIKAQKQTVKTAQKNFDKTKGALNKRPNDTFLQKKAAEAQANLDAEKGKQASLQAEKDASQTQLDEIEDHVKQLKDDLKDLQKSFVKNGKDQVGALKKSYKSGNTAA